MAISGRSRFPGSGHVPAPPSPRRAGSPARGHGCEEIRDVQVISVNRLLLLHAKQLEQTEISAGGLRRFRAVLGGRSAI
jgi:hypothetical protein